MGFSPCFIAMNETDLGAEGVTPQFRPVVDAPDRLLAPGPSFARKLPFETPLERLRLD